MFRNTYDPLIHSYFPTKHAMPMPAWMSDGLDELQMRQDLQRRQWERDRIPDNPYSRPTRGYEIPRPTQSYQQQPAQQINPYMQQFMFQPPSLYDDSAVTMHDPRGVGPQYAGTQMGGSPNMSVRVVDPRDWRG